MSSTQSVIVQCGHFAAAIYMNFLKDSFLKDSKEYSSHILTVFKKGKAMFFLTRLAVFFGLIFISAAANAQVTYEYDERGRLKEVSYPNISPFPDTTIKYTYDDANNRTQEKIENVPTSLTCTYTINGHSTTRLNLYSFATHTDNNCMSGGTATKYSGTEDAIIEITLVCASGQSSCSISGSGTASSGSTKNAVDTGTWPSSTYDIALKLIVTEDVELRGGGGKGGNGGDWDWTSGKNGYDGGHGINLNNNITIVNDGYIAGGGGGGGGGKAFEGTGSGDDKYYTSYGGGGGGGGWPNGQRGYGGDGGQSGNSGGNGTSSGGGAGGTGYGSAYNGGAGGNAGANGSYGGGSTGGDPGDRGYSIKLNGKVLVISGSGTHTATGS